MEIWKNIPGFEGRYQVSSEGRVRSLHSSRERVLRAGTAKNGYLMVALGRGNSRAVHRLVAEAFHGPCPEGLECAHQNGDRQDARAENLVWVNRVENARHRRLHGTHRAGEAINFAKLTEQDVRQIRLLLKTGCTQRAIAGWFGISPSQITNIKLGRTWTCVGEAP